MPQYIPSLPGGILADDMGLGKTLEVLGCILMNPRVNIPKYEIKIDESQMDVQKTNFSCVCGNVPQDISKNSERAYACRSCNVWTHIKCVSYSGPENLFLCPRCCTLQKPISSGCTLIVTPSVISHQWIDEIKKHIPNKDLNVLLYRGCTVHGFLQPRDLANLDICITTYDVLSNELNHVQSMEILPNLRQTKRFMKIPSPLICVEWWRICLDEAQMVHSTNAKCADMASRLHAVNRWCVTGTPIGRSLSGL
jgi:E3 ubiquitin-protein ligase SHPRH